jgi:DNA excision repair protein ERCC-2
VSASPAAGSLAVPSSAATAAPAYIVAVRALCEFTAKQGDLDLRFTPSPTAQEGIAGHAVVTARRPEGYQREVRLSGRFGALLVRGRADGFDPASGRLDEIKTYRGDLSAMPANHRHLHWAQAKVYAHLLCSERGLDQVRVALVYFDIASQKETVLEEVHGAAALADYFNRLCSRFLAWAEQEIAHRGARDAALAGMAFPHPAFRPGQRQLAEAMYRASSRGCALLAQAPTGIGKTIGSLFPAMKAAPGQRLDKIFFLAAKTSGRRLALDACEVLRDAAPALQPGLRVLELVAKTKACEHPGQACHGESCPLANGFYDRLPAARSAALQGQLLDKAGLRDIALAHQVCPYYLGMEMARWSDVIVGDYNYYFDSSAMLHGLTVANEWKVAVLVDEAHNMVARARKMYSAELPHAGLGMLRKEAPAELRKVLDRLHRCWSQLEKEQLQATDGRPERDYVVLAGLPEKFMAALQAASADAGAYLQEHPRLVDEPLQRFYFDTLQFTRLAEQFDTHSLFDLSREQARTGISSTLSIRNVVPAPFLKPRFAASHSTALFSATLSPWNYYSDTLGMPADTAWVDVESPFQAAQLSVKVVDTISTRYQHRAASLSPIADLMARQYLAQPGNYLAFFSSFDYLDQVAGLFAQRYPDIPIWRQERRMDEAARDQFLARFTLASRGIGFAVLGGSFGEGIDLPGARLIGAFIATLGLPQMNPVNEEIRQRMGVLFGAGYDYAYLYPGMQKVVQAAGRVIRTQLDQGVVYLIDDRFARPEIRQLMPGWWDVRTGGDPGTN